LRAIIYGRALAALDLFGSAAAAAASGSSFPFLPVTDKKQQSGPYRPDKRKVQVVARQPRTTRAQHTWLRCESEAPFTLCAPHDDTTFSLMLMAGLLAASAPRPHKSLHPCTQLFSPAKAATKFIQLQLICISGNMFCALLIFDKCLQETGAGTIFFKITSEVLERPEIFANKHYRELYLVCHIFMISLKL
jgi:hypothetical protein